ncbi:MAG: AAA family ATPase [Proteobacteria bacterium]|nr:AAA family ATPase [Pseudomonadota bacterium]MBU1714676.1 AAA family ATPase [Pseudomonadota bacterium]
MPPANKLFVFWGMVASGKSTLAKAWAKRHGLRHHNSDRLRKELAAIPLFSHDDSGIDQGIYSRKFTRRTYDLLLERARQDLTDRKNVILDASYQSRHERDLVRELAEKMGVEVYFVLCFCSDDEVTRRLKARALDPDAVSDGSWEVYLKQKESFEEPDELKDGQMVRFLSEGPLETLLDRLDEQLVHLL